MTPAVLAIPSGLFRLQCLFKSLFLPSPRAFSSSLVLDTEETPAMKALKHIPYPSTSPDLSIFESRSDEYDSVGLPPPVAARKIIESAESFRSVNQSYHPSLGLEQLSRRGKFAEAELVRQQLAEMNVPIRPSSAYYDVAWNVLRKRPWPPNHAEMFSNWLSLLPDKASDQNPFNFIYFLKSALLFDSPRLDLNTVAQFGIVLSSKGYIQDVAFTVVTCLTRYADPDVSSQILDEMIAANNDYNRGKLGTTHHVSTREIELITQRLWSVAVRTHCTAGRPEVAFKMAERADEHGFWLTKFTYAYLLEKLNADGLNDLAAELRAHPCCETLDVTKRPPVVDVSNLTSIPPISREQSMAANQAIALEILKRGSPQRPALATDIVPYFDIYKTHVRGGLATNMLRSRAYRISLPALSTVLLAEQLHHHRRGQFRHVLWVFKKFFHVVGVPSEDITRQLWKREHYPTRLRIEPWYIPPRITKTTFNLPSRLWPTPRHTALVWSALVHLCEGEEELLALYHLLLRHSEQFRKPTIGNHQRDDHHRDHQPPSHGSSNGNPTLVPAPADRFDAAHFRPFLIAFTLFGDAKNGLQVLDDMQDHGIAPSTQILGISAALQARRGEPRLALRMLDIVQGLLECDKKYEEADVDVEMEIKLESRAGSARVGAGKRAKKRQSLLTTYTSVLRGFIDRRYIAQARRVAELLHSHLGYNSGNARTDATLRYLHRLEVEGRDAIPEPVTKVDHYPFLRERDNEVCTSIFFFLFLKKIKLHLLLYPSGDNPRSPLLFPWGKGNAVLAMWFYFGTDRSTCTAY
jgi:hypothetical protein